MITRKELGYVNTWANKVPYPGIHYCEAAMEKLKNSFELYKNEYMDVKYNISFSNNEEIEFEILQRNICHMLGIDSKNLSGEFFKSFRKDVLNFNPEETISSFDLISSLIENSDKVLEYDQNHTARAINYYKIGIKCDIFNKLANLSDFNYGCINFNRKTFDKNNLDINFASKSTKFLYTPSDEVVSPYFMMGIKTDDTKEQGEEELEEKYFVETLIAPEKIQNMFKGQEVVIPTQIMTDKKGTLVKTEASPSSKIKLLKDYQSIINEYKLNSHMNIYSDYLSMLMDEERDSKKTLSKRK